MQPASAPPSPASLAAEYLFWSLVFAASPGILGTLAALLDPNEIYVERYEVVRSVINWSPPLFVVSTMPLILVGLWHFVRQVWRRPVRSARTSASIGLRTADLNSSEGGSDFASPTEVSEQVAPQAGPGIILEYVGATFLTPIVFVMIGFLLGGSRSAEFVSRFYLFIWIVAAVPGLLIGGRFLLKFFTYRLLLNR